MKIGLFADLHYAKGITYGTRQCGQSLLKLQRILNRLSNADLLVNLGDALNEGASPRDNAGNLQAFQAVLPLRSNRYTMCWAITTPMPFPARP